MFLIGNLLNVVNIVVVVWCLVVAVLDMLNVLLCFVKHGKLVVDLADLLLNGSCYSAYNTSSIVVHFKLAQIE